MKCDKWLHIYGNKLGTGVNCEWVYDVRENIKGEWIEKYYESNETGETVFHGMIMCSVCGHVPKVGWLSNFCPNCGAEMRHHS